MNSDNLSYLLINPFDKTVTPVYYDGELGSLYHLLQCSTVAVVHCGPHYDLFVDDEGLYKADQKYFLCEDFPLQPLAGMALAVAVNDRGSTVPPHITLEALEARVLFVDGVVFEDEEG